MSEPKMSMRVALRGEGDWWVAYFAMPDTMDSAIEVGRIAMRLVQHPAQQQAFVDLMRDTLKCLVKDLTGADVTGFETRRAPEHERGGRA